MKIKLLRNPSRRLNLDIKGLKEGQTGEVEDDVAGKLIAAHLAEDVTPPEPKSKN